LGAPCEAEKCLLFFQATFFASQGWAAMGSASLRLFSPPEKGGEKELNPPHP
jgi:hypothetical protein